MLTNLVRMFPCLRVGKRVFSGQQPCHSMYIESGVYPFLPAFEILARENFIPRDVGKRFCVGRRHSNQWCSSNG